MNPHNRDDQLARRVRALSLRRAGLSYDAIARELDLPHRSNARHLIETAREEMRRESRETLQELVDLQSERLEFMLASVWPDITQGTFDQRMRAIEKALRISERFCALHGLDAPKRVQATLDVPGVADLLRMVASNGVTVQASATVRSLPPPPGGLPTAAEDGEPERIDADDPADDDAALGPH